MNLEKTNTLILLLFGSLRWRGQLCKRIFAVNFLRKNYCDRQFCGFFANKCFEDENFVDFLFANAILRVCFMRMPILWIAFVYIGSLNSHTFRENY